MFYTELDPYTLEPVYVPKTMKEKHMQRALLQYFNPKNKELVISALHSIGRDDLIGTGKNCLVTPSTNMKKNSAKSPVKNNKGKKGGVKKGKGSKPKAKGNNRNKNKKPRY
jgi:hypothetical protein